MKYSKNKFRNAPVITLKCPKCNKEFKKEMTKNEARELLNALQGYFLG